MSKRITGKDHRYHRDHSLFLVFSSAENEFFPLVFLCASINTAAHQSWFSIPFWCASVLSSQQFLSFKKWFDRRSNQQSQRNKGIVGNVRKVVGEIRNV